jgi:hypothetical protein
MPVKVYKRTDTARTIDYQDELLYRKYPEVISAPVFFDGDRDQLTRQTQRSIKDTIYTASLALFADTEDDLIEFMKAVKKRGLKLVCAEEDIKLDNKPIGVIVAAWRDARKHGAAMRGARKSAETKKANTAAAMKLIEHELASTDIPSKVLLAKVGIRAIGSIKNHFGFPREELQKRHRAEQKRKARREAYREQRAN